MRKPRHIGVTGTRSGGSPEQLAQLTDILDRVRALGFAVLHHGDAQGVDAQAYALARNLGGFKTFSHPPDVETYRAFTKFNEYEYPPMPYLDRNHKLVDEVEVLLALPLQAVEVLRSGTWATVRYARRVRVTTMIVKRNGLLLVEDNV
jgi:hypothetical protein